MITQSCYIAALSHDLTLKLPWLYWEKWLLSLEGRSFSRSAAIAFYPGGCVHAHRASRAAAIVWKDNAGLRDIRCDCCSGATPDTSLLLMVGITGTARLLIAHVVMKCENDIVNIFLCRVLLLLLTLLVVGEGPRNRFQDGTESQQILSGCG